jgi:hypothetical protein
VPGLDIDARDAFGVVGFCLAYPDRKTVHEGDLCAISRRCQVRSPFAFGEMKSCKARDEILADLCLARHGIAHVSIFFSAKRSYSDSASTMPTRRL